MLFFLETNRYIGKAGLRVSMYRDVVHRERVKLHGSIEPLDALPEESLIEQIAFVQDEVLAYESITEAVIAGKVDAADAIGRSALDVNRDFRGQPILRF